ncbi:inorganic pyrophosphatase [Nematocida displodere]|uniref:inorganic diphosphatase n=1 Tax=Nematocida displodere TaxID=1805483 RepID=A0A177EGD0_9MICR|nr:inorganic pyrophosphatase [Nematocida displodere]
MAYGIRAQGTEYTEGFKAYITEGDRVISPFHDIPMIPQGEQFPIVHVVNEIPRFTNAKKEINKEEKFNPIKQDIKNGKVRFITNVFPQKGYLWNYGAIPQTWESTTVDDSWAKCKGDNDPIDAIEIGASVLATGEVYQAKILGAIAMIDGGECDWKVLVIKKGDPLFDKINNLKQVEEHMPGLLDVTREWFRNYKLPSGAPRNEFALNEEYLDAEEAIKVVKETNKHWIGLVQEQSHEGISLVNGTNEGTPGHTTEAYAPEGQEYEPKTEPQEAHDFFFAKSFTI